VNIILNTIEPQNIVRSAEPDAMEFLTLQPGRQAVSDADYKLIQADPWGAHLLEEGLLVVDPPAQASKAASGSAT